MRKYYYGKYRALVHSINDPEKRGRIRVICPKVLDNAVSSWCEPCVPIAYEKGGDFALPKINDAVWIEFEDGDVSKPVYSGGWWSTNNTPSKDYDTAERIISWGNTSITIKGDVIKIDVPESDGKLILKNVYIGEKTLEEFVIDIIDEHLGE